MELDYILLLFFISKKTQAKFSSLSFMCYYTPNLI